MTTKDLQLTLTRGEALWDLLAEVSPQEWTARPNCIESDPDLFYPKPSEAGMTALAKTICSDCPIRSACLQHALANDERHGVWGGMTEQERRELRRQTAEEAA